MFFMVSEIASYPKESNGQKEKWQITLDRLYGSVKNIKRLTKEERNNIAEEMTEEEGIRLFKKYGLL